MTKEHIVVGGTYEHFHHAMSSSLRVMHRRCRSAAALGLIGGQPGWRA